VLVLVFGGAHISNGPGGAYISNGSGGAYISNGPGGAYISNGSGGAYISNGSGGADTSNNLLGIVCHRTYVLVLQRCSVLLWSMELWRLPNPGGACQLGLRVMTSPQGGASRNRVTFVSPSPISFSCGLHNVTYFADGEGEFSG
jgi:hypothetical protein